MIIQACINGARPASFHPALPTTPDAIAADAAAAVAAGAHEVHLHVRDASGAETLAPATVEHVLRLVRARVPGTLVGISTGAWIERDDDRRLAHIGAWPVRPDYAGVNFNEPGAPGLFERLFRCAIPVEAGLATVADAERMIRLQLGERAWRHAIEIGEQDRAAAIAQAEAILATLAHAGLTRPILLHGFDDSAWPLARMARARGFALRIGLEDTSQLPDGTVAAGNADLVRAAAA